MKIPPVSVSTGIAGRFQDFYFESYIIFLESDFTKHLRI